MTQPAPRADPNLPWPINGLAYIIEFMGPLSAGPLLGVFARDWRAIAIGLLAAIGIDFVNAWLSDTFLEPWIAKFQKPLQKGLPWVLANIAAFAKAIALCAISMLAPIALLGTEVLTKIR